MSNKGISAAQVCGRGIKELFPIVKNILKDLNEDGGFTHGELIERIEEDDRLSLKEKIMTAHFIGQRR